MNDTSLAIVGGGIAGLTLAWLWSNAGVPTHVYERRAWSSLQAQMAWKTTYFFPTYHRALGALYDYLGLYTEPRPLAYFYDGMPLFEETDRLLHKPRCFGFTPFANRRLKADMHRLARSVQRKDNQPISIPLKQYLHGLGLSTRARTQQVPAILGGLWQYPWTQMNGLPANLCLAFLHLVNARPEVRCLCDGLAAYVQRLRFKGNFTLHHDSPVTQVTRDEDGLTIQTAAGPAQHYDRVILTCNLDETKRIVAPLTKEEEILLGKMHYVTMPAYVHTDTSVVPRRLGRARHGCVISSYQIKQDLHFAYHYDLRLLQDSPFYLSLNPAKPIAASALAWQGKWRRLATNITTLQSMRALDTIQGQGGLWHAGDYTMYQTSPLNTKLMAALDLTSRCGLQLPFKI